MKRTNKKSLIITILLAFFLTVYVFYPTTATVSTEGIDWVTINEIGRTAEEQGVVATIKGPKTVNLNDNVTFTYTVTNKRSETIFLEDIPGNPPISLGSLKPGETKTFTKNIRMRETDDGVTRYEDDRHENSTLRIFYPFLIWGVCLDFNDNKGNWIGMVRCADLRYETSWCLNPPF